MMTRQARRHPDPVAVADKARRITAEIVGLRLLVAAMRRLIVDLRDRLPDPADVERVDRFLADHPEVSDARR